MKVEISVAANKVERKPELLELYKQCLLLRQAGIYITALSVKLAFFAVFNNWKLCPLPSAHIIASSHMKPVINAIPFESP